MAYSTVNDLLKEFSRAELARLTGDPTGQAIDEERCAQAIRHADALIDAYLYGAYTFEGGEETPSLINKLSIELAVAKLYDYAYRSGAVPNSVVWRKLDALKALKELADSKITLPGSQKGSNAPPFFTAARTGEGKEFSELFGEEN